MRARRKSLVAVFAAGALMAGVLPVVANQSADAGATTYKVATAKLPDGRTVLARWNPCQVVSFRVNSALAAKTNAGRNAAINDVKTAFAKLSAVNGVTYRYAGTTREVPTNTSSTRWYSRQKAAEIVVAWVSPSSTVRSNLLGKSGSSYAAGTGGYAFKYWKVTGSPWTGASGRGFVVLDARQNSKFKPGFGAGTTRGELLLHEIGHSVGLQHVTASSQVMYPTVLKRSVAAYNSGDRTGLIKLGRSAGCVNVPSWVWKDI